MQVQTITPDQAQDLQDYFDIEDRDQCIAFIAEQYGVYYIIVDPDDEVTFE